jgi:hypothetical protein
MSAGSWRRIDPECSKNGREADNPGHADRFLRILIAAAVVAVVAAMVAARVTAVEAAVVVAAVAAIAATMVAPWSSPWCRRGYSRGAAVVVPHGAAVVAP